MIGAPDTIRTCDLCLRRATLYPAELRVLSPRLADWPPTGNGPAGLLTLEWVSGSFGYGHASHRLGVGGPVPGAWRRGGGSIQARLEWLGRAVHSGHLRALRAWLSRALADWIPRASSRRHSDDACLQEPQFARTQNIYRTRTTADPARGQNLRRVVMVKQGSVPVSFVTARLQMRSKREC
jgi:hypothetical protein